MNICYTSKSSVRIGHGSMLPNQPQVHNPQKSLICILENEHVTNIRKVHVSSLKSHITDMTRWGVHGLFYFYTTVVQRLCPNFVYFLR